MIDAKKRARTFIGKGSTWLKQEAELTDCVEVLKTLSDLREELIAAQVTVATQKDSLESAKDKVSNLLEALAKQRKKKPKGK